MSPETSLDCMVEMSCLASSVTCELEVDSYISLKLSVSFVVGMVDWTTLETHYSSESIEVPASSGSSNLSSESMTSDGSHSDFVVIHKSDDVLAHLLHAVARMVIRAALVSVVK